jgi:hypothetical protein
MKQKSAFSKQKRIIKNPNPKSLENLTHDGRKTLWGEPKKKRTLTLTDTCWQTLEQWVSRNGERSISELLEALTRGMIEVENLKYHSGGGK